MNSWQVLDSINSNSDHLFIHFTLNLREIKNNNFHYKTLNSSFKKFNRIFENYVMNMQVELDNVKNQNDLDTFINDFQNIVQTVMEVCFKKRSLCFSPKLS